MAGDVLSEKIHVPPVRSMVRDRLDTLISAAREHRIALVIGPAGCGKTTLLARFVETAEAPVAWFQADEADGDADAVLRYLDAAFGVVVPDFGRHDSIDAMMAAIETVDGPVHLVIDDLHTLHGTEAEQVLGRLIRYFPRASVVMAATRFDPAIDLGRLRLSGGLLEIDADALRFRTWEVEQLFRDHYASPLRPTELAELTRRTGGWAAGLQLFHLATDGKPVEARREVLDALATRSRVVRDYLIRNVLDGLAPALRAFLLETCVLSDVDPELCDELRGDVGSGALLAELDRRQLLVTARAGNAYRYHEVLRHHLRSMLLDEIGDAAVRERFAAAARLLERRDRVAQALSAYASAGDDDAVRRLLGVSGEALAGDPGDWIASIPPAVVGEDPWVSLAVARWRVRTGQITDAINAYRHAESLFGAGRGAEICHRERTVLLSLRSGSPSRTAGGEPWMGRVQLALRRDIGRPGPPPETGLESLVAGIDAVVSGAVTDGLERLHHLRDDDSVVVRAVAALVAAYAPHWAPSSAPAPASVTTIVSEGEAIAGPWFGRIGAALTALSGTSAAILAADEIAGEEGADGWSRLLASYAAACGRIHDPGRRCEAQHAFRRCRELAVAADVPVIGAWASAGEALAVALEGRREAVSLSADAEATARSTQVPGPEVVAAAARALVDHDSDALDRVTARAREMGIDLALLHSIDAPGQREASVEIATAGAAPTPTALGTFGGLSLTVGGAPAVIDDLKPRWRSLLAYLALNVGSPVHRDTIVDALWPSSAEVSGRRSLQVAISALRSALEAGGVIDIRLPRAGETYELELAAGVACDHRDVGIRPALRPGRGPRRRPRHDRLAARRRARDMSRRAPPRGGERGVGPRGPRALALRRGRHRGGARRRPPRAP